MSTESVSSVPVEPPVQRLATSDPVTSTPAPHTPISQTVQRTPVEDVADAAFPALVMPVDAPMQRSVEAAPSIPTTASLQATEHKPTEHKPTEHKPTDDGEGSAPNWSQPADLPVQRMVETTPSAPSAPASSLPAPVTPVPPIVQRAAVDAGDETPAPTSVVPPAMPSGMASEPPLQRVAGEPSFHPITRHRDPRILARKVEPSRPVIQPDLALSRNEALAVLPQARVASAPSVADVVQRTPVHTAQRLAVEAPVSKVSGPASIGPVPMTASPSIQRSPDETTVADRPVADLSVASERVRVQSVSPRSSSVIRRTPLTLAKLRVSSSQSTVQREETEEVGRDSFIGASAGDGIRGSTEPQRMSGITVQQSKSPVLQRNPSTPSSEDEGIEDESSEQNETRRQEAPNLDLIARAIVPLVKRMLTIERERRIYR